MGCLVDKNKKIIHAYEVNMSNNIFNIKKWMVWKLRNICFGIFFFFKEHYSKCLKAILSVIVILFLRGVLFTPTKFTQACFTTTAKEFLDRTHIKNQTVLKPSNLSYSPVLDDAFTETLRSYFNLDLGKIKYDIYLKSNIDFMALSIQSKDDLPIFFPVKINIFENSEDNIIYRGIYHEEQKINKEFLNYNQVLEKIKNSNLKFSYNIAINTDDIKKIATAQLKNNQLDVSYALVPIDHLHKITDYQKVFSEIILPNGCSIELIVKIKNIKTYWLVSFIFSFLLTSGVIVLLNEFKNIIFKVKK